MLLPVMALAAEPLPGQDILDKISAFIMSAGGATATIAVVLEFALRMVKSKKPLSILYMIAGLMTAVGTILVKAGALLDRVLPQRVADPK